MEYKSTVISCVERIPDTDAGAEALRRIHAIAKRAGKEKRLSPTARPDKRRDETMRDEVFGVMIRNRAAR